METSGLRHVRGPYGHGQSRGACGPAPESPECTAAIAVDPTLFGTARATRDCLIRTLDMLGQIDGSLQSAPQGGGECRQDSAAMDDLFSILGDCNSIAHRIAALVNDIGIKVGQ
jgi:hypothetical protein